MSMGERSPGRRLLSRLLLACLLVLLMAAGAFAWHEATRSTLQARWLGTLAREMDYELAPGASDAIRFPGAGPYDRRMGYSLLPGFAERLAGQGFELAAQARISAAMADAVDRGLFVPYRPKTAAGLGVLDCSGDELHRVRDPAAGYAHADEIPDLVARTLAFIEDRDLLANPHPTRNPAIDWSRSIRAGLDLVRGRFDPDHPQPGGSTLATQIEKYRHSPGGVTDSPAEKLRQMASASLRAYLDGPDTTAARRRIVLDYLNTVPLAARSGYGEVNGLADGLWAWYGAEFARVNELLRDAQAPLEERALAYRQVLSLMIAHRRPSQYLGRDPAALVELTDAYLRVLATAGLIAPALRDAALRARADLLPAAPVPPRESFVRRKAATAARVELSRLLDVPRLYDLDRLDLTVQSTIDRPLQEAVTRALADLATPRGAAAAVLLEPRLLAGADPAGVTYSFTLFETTAAGNVVRVQTDNVDQPFDSNAGLRLDLGSTAKLRVVVHYLELVARLHARLGSLGDEALVEERLAAPDALTRWTIDRLLTTPSEVRSLEALLAAALERPYSASPHEAFRTGGSLLRFQNFDRDDDERTLTIRDAFRRSVNLVFVRLQRDVVDHLVAARVPDADRLLADAGDPRRREYLERFADLEGGDFVRRFHARHSGRSAAESDELLVRPIRATPARLAALHRYLYPEAGLEDFAAWLRERLPVANLPAAELAGLHARFGEQRLSLVDRAHVAGVHPLELWTARFLRERPTATRQDVVAASAAERRAAYAWLFRTRSKAAQDVRIRAVLERAGFEDVLVAWQWLGYPFQTLSPSLGAALGSAADRPAALAELVGILVNDGLRIPKARIGELRFAEGTPFETHFAATPPVAERVLPAEVAVAARSLLAGVVEGGTAARLQGVFRAPDGTVLAVGGKTGTADHRVDTLGRDGRLLASHVVSRSGTFVFHLGPRHFGTITAYVSGPRAGDYRFTSALPTQVLRSLAPLLESALWRAPGDGVRCERPSLESRPVVAPPAVIVPRPPVSEPLDTAPAPPRDLPEEDPAAAASE